MASIHRSALVEYSAEQMFDLVNDIENYPAYMDGCSEAVVISQNEEELVGKLTLRKAGIKQQFTTRNRLTRPVQIDMKLVEGKFKSFSSRWSFIELSDEACKVSLDMDFELDFALVDFAAERLLSAAANSLVDSLVTRAKQVYG